MHLRNFTRPAIVFALTLAMPTICKAGTPVNPAPKQTLDEPWAFTLSTPGWIPWMTGTTGIDGHNSSIDLAPKNIVPRWDMVASLRGEAHKERFSILGEFLYMSLSDGVGTNTALKKMDFQVDQTMADFGLAYRIYQGPRGYVDVIGGVRYTNLYQKVALQPNDAQIDAIASKASVAVSAAHLGRALRSLEGGGATVPGAPLAAGQPGALSKSISHIKGTVAERKQRIAGMLHDSLGQTLARTDDWWDPYIGLRAHYNLSSRLYADAKADIGGFGVGSQLTWQARAALGCNLTANCFAELGYRALGVDYEHTGLLVDTITHGVEINLGLAF